LKSKDIPILENKYVNDPTVFTPESLLREARRQKSLPKIKVPEICILDPDGDIVHNLVVKKRALHHPTWAQADIEFGIIGCVVGAPFAVLVAEELFASGCKLLISVTSAGQILPARNPPYFVLIDQALRDEGTSYHYLPPAKYSTISEKILGMMKSAFEQSGIVIMHGLRGQLMLRFVK
jgi:hypothetical protein